LEFRTLYCGDVRVEHVGQEITLAGWLHRRRDHGGLVFIDLRDSRGIVQVVINPTEPDLDLDTVQEFRNEWLIQVTGTVSERPEGTVNMNLPTGQTEVLASSVNVINPSNTPPFNVNDSSNVDESLRMKYRYLDLRRPNLQENLWLRHRVVKHIRDFLDDKGFIEIETPILIKSTPEGARDYLVPSRVHRGQFYALPQSPQQLKQLLMVSGFDKYFQIARCFRDEDLRADRQPEFTQLDLEMSFVTERDVLNLTEDLYLDIMAKLAPEFSVTNPMPRIKYQDAMDRYGTDKPDIRFALELKNLSAEVQDFDFTVFKDTLAAGGCVKAISAPGCSSYSRKQMAGLTEFAVSRGASGLITIAVDEDGEQSGNSYRSVLSKYLSDAEMHLIAKATDASPGDLILIVAGKPKIVNAVLGDLRLELRDRLNLVDQDTLAFCFITDFPLFDWNEEKQRWDSSHHPFTSPTEEDEQYLDTDPGRVISKAYDLVCNGSELASGSIRIHRRALQEKVLAILGYTSSEMLERFNQLLEAFDYGAPPHGGIAPGIDRFIALLSRNATSIRDVIAFPKTQAATDPLFGSPDEVSTEQLRDLGLRIVPE
tara:strand:+ start:2189 stop:3976 length:1788 start_codon:yes stop_codon:yes gene_type:complete